MLLILMINRKFLIELNRLKLKHFKRKNYYQTNYLDATSVAINILTREFLNFFILVFLYLYLSLECKQDVENPN